MNLEEILIKCRVKDGVIYPTHHPTRHGTTGTMAHQSVYIKEHLTRYAGVPLHSLYGISANLDYYQLTEVCQDTLINSFHEYQYLVSLLKEQQHKYRFTCVYYGDSLRFIYSLFIQNNKLDRIKILEILSHYFAFNPEDTIRWLLDEQFNELRAWVKHHKSKLNSELQYNYVINLQTQGDDNG